MERSTRRWSPIIRLGPYLLLAADAAIGWALSPPGQHGWMLIGLDALVFFVCFTAVPRWRGRPWSSAVIVLTTLVSGAIMTALEPWTGVVAVLGYVLSFALVSWPWQLISVGAFAVLAATAQVGGVPGLGGTAAAPAALPIYGATVLINVVAMCTVGWVLHRIMTESDGRRVMLDEIRRVNLRLEESLAENAALQARLVAQARATGVLDERRRLARELHDTLAQGVVAVITQLGAAQAEVDAVDRTHVDRALAIARSTLREARLAVDALRPQALDAGSVSEALRAVADEWSARTAVSTDVRVAGSPRPVPPDAEVVLVRVAQEALSNVARHARASRVALTVSWFDDRVVLDVRDDGVGFDRGDERDGAFGLVAMRDRVEGADGRLVVESTRAEGTTVSVSLAVGRESVP
jgi:signal transduction histidine kinase